MEIRLDEKIIAETLNAQVNTAIRDAFDTHAVRRIIEEQVAGKVIAEIIRNNKSPY